MTDAEIIKVLENEMECVRRQDTPKCPRFVGMTCAACDLITDTSKVLEAFQDAIDALKTRIKERERLIAEIDRMAEDEEALKESRYLDAKDGTIKGRWNT